MVGGGVGGWEAAAPTRQIIKPTDASTDRQTGRRIDTSTRQGQQTHTSPRDANQNDRHHHHHHHDHVTREKKTDAPAAVAL